MEVSLALRLLRKKFDDIHKATKEKEMDLELIRKGVQKISAEEKAVEKYTSGADDEYNQGKEDLAKIELTHQFEQFYWHQYQHMLKRMKKDLIVLQLRSNDLTESLRSKNQIYKEESEKQRIAKENKLQSKYRLDNLMKSIDHEQKKRQELIISLQTSIKDKEEALQKRVDRVKRQQEIAEAAANENKDQNEITQRANFMVQKLWCAFLKRKMENEMKKYHNLEEALQKIRTSTGNSDVQEMVNKFLTREQTYSLLLTAVNENEKKVEHLREENDKKEEILHNLQIDNDNQQNNNDNISGSTASLALKDMGPNPNNPEIYSLLQEIQSLKKEYEIINNRKKNMHLVCDQVQSWSSKVALKLNKQLQPKNGKTENQLALKPGEGKKSMSEVFQNITNMVCSQLQEIIDLNNNKKMQNQDAGIDNQSDGNINDEFDVNQKEFMNDFATDEFINKNIRVRPVSGLTTNEKEEQKSEVFGARTLLGQGFDGNQMDDDEKFNQQINYDMDASRKKVKENREKFLKQKQHEAEMAEKKNQKK